MKERKKKNYLKQRMQRLLETALVLQNQNKDVNFENVAALYADVASEEDEKTGKHRRQGAFYSDCKKLQDILSDFRDVFSPLCLPIPQVSYRSGRLNVSARESITRISPERSVVRRRLAKEILNATLPDGSGPLIPRDGTLFLGTGNTCCLIWREIVASDNFHDATIWSPNLDILLEKYLGLNSAIRFLRYWPSKARIDWDNGCQFPLRKTEDQKFGCAVISFEFMDESGGINADTLERANLIKRALEMSSRICLIGESAKFGATGGNPIPLPLGADGRIFLCSNEDPPSNVILPTSVTFLKI